MPSFSFLRVLPFVAGSICLLAPSFSDSIGYLGKYCWSSDATSTATLSDDPSIPGAFVDSPDPEKTAESPGLSLRELLADAAREAICNMLADANTTHSDTRIFEDRAQRAQDELFSQSQAQDMKRKLCNEINHETRRCRTETASLCDALQAMLERVVSVEMGQIKLEVRLQEAVAQRGKDASTIDELRAELVSARESIAELDSAGALQASMLNIMRVELGESKRRADTAWDMLRRWKEPVQRWIAEELRQKREAEERRKREEEAARIEKERRRKEAEKERQRQEAEAQAQREQEEEDRRQRDEEARARREWWKSPAEKHRDAMLARWARYQAPLRSKLTFKTVIWPVLVPPTKISDLTLKAIREFLLSDLHSKGKSNKQRLNDALVRWHSDKRSPVVRALANPNDEQLIKDAFHEISIHLNHLKSLLC